VSILPTVHGEKVVLRLIATQSLATLEALGLSEAALSYFNTYLDRSEGLILLSGSTGSGKTTTLYAALSQLSKRNLNIVAVEDPVEYYVTGVTQTAIDERIGLTYPTVLRAILRQDPDVVLIGEIRDNESAQIAIQAAMTGHLMLSTVHARSAAEVVTRLRFLGVDPLSLVQALQLSVNQKLFPKLCQQCKVIDLAASRTFGADVYKAVGCPRCSHTGASGQIPAFEILEVRGQVAEIITSQDPNLVAELISLRSIRIEDEIRKLVFSGTIAAEAINTNNRFDDCSVKSKC
jgi:general secretion pathway protein E